MDQKYSIDAKVIDSAEIGGFISEPTYVCVAHRCPDYTFEWPEEQESFTGWKHLIRDDTDETSSERPFSAKIFAEGITGVQATRGGNPARRR